jgi:hypothetical protein
MLDQLLESLATIPQRVLLQPAQLTGGFSLEHHGHVRGRQEPGRGSWRHVLPFQVRLLVTVDTLECIPAAAITASLDVLVMGTAIVTLEGNISCWVTVHAPGMHEHHIRFQKGLTGTGVIAANHIFSLRNAGENDI